MKAMNCLALSMISVATVATAADWPQWGGNGSRNMVSGEKNLATAFEPGMTKAGSEEIDPSTTKNIKWVARLGGQSYGNPTIAGGKVFLGTNNEPAKNPKLQDDRGVVMALDEKTGKMLWQLAIPKLGAGKVVDFEQVGICSSPAVEGDRVYLVTNRCEVLCLDAKGLADGNEGPFTDEAKYVGGDVGAGDGDIVWRYNMYDELGVFPHNQTSSSVLVVGDRIYASTSNSRDWTMKHIPAPDAPALICLDKKTGKLLGIEKSGITRGTFLSNWSSPAHGNVGGRDLIIFGGGDGICYAFEAAPVDGVLKEAWKVDCNPVKHKESEGKPIPYGSDKGPSEIIGTPVVHEGKAYVAVGQGPENGDGVGNLTCIDIATGKPVWSSQEIQRTMSTAAVSGGLVFIPDFAGYLYCFDAATGKLNWKHDTEGRIWGSPLVAEGRVYVGNETGDVIVLEAKGGEKAVEVGRSTLEGPVYSSPVAANGVVYIMGESRLWAVEKKE